MNYHAFFFLILLYFTNSKPNSTYNYKKRKEIILPCLDLYLKLFPKSPARWPTLQILDLNLHNHGGAIP